MSAKNTAVNLIILTTFLSFILYRRGNKVATVPWANTGKLLQVLAFALTAAYVIYIGVGGYIPSMWLESSARVAKSPNQVIAVLACILLVLPIDILMFRGARELGKIRWGQVSNRSQYALIFLAVTFTWTMWLMGFARSSLRQHWHVYEVMRDSSPWAYTPTLGYATIVITCVVVLFFLLVSVVVWVSKLGAHDEAHLEVAEPTPPWRKWLYAGGVVALVAALAFGMRQPPEPLPAGAELQRLRKREARDLGRYELIDKDKGVFQVPIDRAMELLVQHPECIVTPQPGGKAKVENCPYW